MTIEELEQRLEEWAKHCADQERAIAALHEAIDLQSETIRLLRSAMDNEPLHGRARADAAIGRIIRV